MSVNVREPSAEPTISCKYTSVQFASVTAMANVLSGGGPIGFFLQLRLKNSANKKITTRATNVDF